MEKLNNVIILTCRNGFIISKREETPISDGIICKSFDDLFNELKIVLRDPNEKEKEPEDLPF